MAIGEKINSLKKDGSKEDKVAVASGIAVSVVIVLLVCWAIYFFHNLQKGAQQTNLSAGAQDQFNFSSTQQAQQDLQQQLGGQNTDQFIDIHNQIEQQGGAQMQTQEMQTQGQQTDSSFGNQ